MATIRLEIDKGLIIFCSECYKPLNDNYYVHQCKKIKHSWCLECLIEKNICKKCNIPYINLFIPKK